MDLKNLVILISKLRDLDKSAEFASEIEILETAIENTDERGYELIQDDYNRLAQKIDLLDFSTVASLRYRLRSACYLLFSVQNKLLHILHPFN